MTAKVLEHLRTEHEAAVQRLCDYLRIESIGTDAQYDEACRDAAQWTAKQMRAAGLETQIHTGQGHPIVLGTYQCDKPDAPTVMYYGHYDVQPPDPLALWDSPPFEPMIRDGRIYARGASDDKGQVMTFLEAMRAWHETHGLPDVNLKVFIEGNEESGSEPADAFVAEHKDLLQCDVAVVSDTAMWGPGQPAICYALRGLAYFDVKLFGPSRDLHSGVYGGSVPNPANEMIKVLGQLFDENHHITVDGFYDDVVTLTDEEREQWQNLGFDETEYAKSIGLSELSGEAGYATLERRWARPSGDINGIYGGYMGEGAKTVIPAMAGAKVSFRLAAKQDPHDIEAKFRRWLEKRTPAGCRWQIETWGLAHPVIVQRDSAYLQAAAEAVQEASGTQARLIREGATIPVVSTFKRELGIDTLLMGFGLHDDNLHSPNEKFDLACFDLGCRAHALLLGRLAEW